MAKVRAQNMLSTISPSGPQPGIPSAARKVASNANGMAKTEWEILMSKARQ